MPNSSRDCDSGAAAASHRVTLKGTSHGQVLGVLGVIGPTRMAYDRVIPIVQATAELLGQALNPEPLSP